MVSERPGPSPQRVRAQRAGRRAELIAALWLGLRGYRLLARRVRTPVGEIDLVARRRHRIAFIEVKQRADLTEAIDAVTPHQQQRVRRAAEWWLMRRPADPAEEYGFDVVLLAPWRLPLHLVDAFSHMPYEAGERGGSGKGR
jgi:putative endonuclease